MIERCAAGEEVVRQGDPGEKFYIISDGQVEVLGTDQRGTRRINILNEGDYFGEIGLLREEPRTATVRTITPTQFYSLSRLDFVSLLEREPAIREAVSEVIAKRLAVFAGASGIPSPVKGGAQ